jgi:G3E family GTPase
MTKKTKAPSITLRKFQHAEFASQETTCFEAEVLVDGKAFCIASDEGHGGEMRLDPLKQGVTNNQLMTAIHKVGRKINPNCLRNYKDKAKVDYKWIDDDAERHAAHDKEMAESDNVTSYEVFQDRVSDAVTRELMRGDLKKLMVKKIVWLDRKDDKIYNTRNARNAAARDAWIPTIESKYDCVVLNSMDKEEALDLFIAKCA